MNQQVYSIEDVQTGKTYTVKTCAGAVGSLRLTVEQLKKTSWKSISKLVTLVTVGDYQFKVTECPHIPLSWVR